MSRTALTYWKELGLTPASAKGAPKTEEKKDTLGELRTKYKIVR